MRILGLIPARGGSKGIVGKNIKELGDKALIRYTIEAALNCSLLDEVVVSTEDEAIAAISEKAGATIPFMRPQALATDHSPSIDTIIHAMEFYETKNEPFDAVCLLQPTCPFRSTLDIEKALSIFKKDTPDSLVSVREVPHQYNPHWVFEAVGDSNFLKISTGETQIIPRRQDLPKAYYRDGSIYITKKEVLLQQRSIYGERMAYCFLGNEYHVNLDTLEDWERAERILNKYSNND